MTRRILLLNGIAILAVIITHAAGWGQIALLQWAFRYIPGATPYDQIGTMPYYVLLVIRQLLVFAIPAFLFVSGFFVAYAARSARSGLTWKIVRTRVQNLLIPYLIWSSAIFASDALMHITYTPQEYIMRLVLWGASGYLYFVPMLCEFYLLSPWLVRLARANPKLLLIATGAIQLGTEGLVYLNVFKVPIPGLDLALALMPAQLFIRWIFFFPLGIVCAFHLEELKRLLARFKRHLLAATIVLAPFAVIEPELIYRTTSLDLRWNPMTLPPGLYVLALLFTYLAYDSIAIPFSPVLNKLAANSYGIYLLHFKSMEFIAKLVYHFSPWLLAWQLLYQPLLLFFGLGVVWWSMTGVMRSPARPLSRYLFG